MSSLRSVIFPMLAVEAFLIKCVVLKATKILSDISLLGMKALGLSKIISSEVVLNRLAKGF
jgi:hypothetical protein